MLEIRADFRSYEEWTAWLAQHQSSFESWRANILDEIGRHGLIEPVTGIQHAPDAVMVNRANLRESVSVAEMNSRKRASLVALDLACRALPAERRRRIKVLGDEALSRVARILRGAFVHFLGTEYLPTAEDRERHYPIPHLDLRQAAFPDAAFDVFFGAAVLEQVPDFQHALAEIARMLRPGGIMASILPFNASAAANPPSPVGRSDDDATPAGSSAARAAIAAPGWAILDQIKAAGFADAKATLITSSTYGIVSTPVPGIFVISAAKKQEPEARAPLGSRSFVYDGPRIRRLIGLVGLARSGTTLLCSVLGVHSRIEAVYEPYNANTKRELPLSLGIDRFFTEFPTEMNGKDILLVKETGTQISFLDRTAELLRSALPPIRTDLMVLLRNPLHAFLSTLEARKKWWGGNHEISANAFQTWAEGNVTALGRLLNMGREFNALFVSYENLVTNKETTVPDLMRRLDLPFEQRQLNFEKYVDRRRVRGDITIEKNPFAISDDRVNERAAELAMVTDMIAGAPLFGAISEIARLIGEFGEIGLGRFDAPAVQQVLKPLQEVVKVAGAVA